MSTLFAHQRRVNWDQIVTTHGETIFRAAYRVLGNRHDAEEVTQEVLLELFRKTTSLHEANQDTALLKRMSTFRSIDYLRRRSRAESLSHPDSADVPDGRSNLSETNEQVAILRCAIAELPQRQSKCFWLRHVDGLSNQEIAGLLAISPSAVSTALFKAKKTLQQQFRSKLVQTDD